MTYDLQRELAALGDAERTAAPELPVAALTARAHRRRAVRTGMSAAVALVAIGGIAVAASALPGRTAQPPAQTPTPTPTATVKTDAAWPAVTADGEFVCDQAVPTIIDPAGDADLHLDVVRATSSGAEQALAPGETVTITEGEVFDTSATLVNGTDRELVGRITGKEQLRLEGRIVRDGIVVAAQGPWLTTDILVPPVDIAVLPGETVSAGSNEGAVQSCPGGLIDVATNDYRWPVLPPGTYQVYLTEDVYAPVADDAGLDESDPAAEFALGDLITTLVAGPFTLVVEAAVDPHPALEDLVITTSGLGPLTVGLPPTTNPGAAMIAYDPTYCSDIVASEGGTWGPADGDPGQWLPAGYEPVPGYWNDAPTDAFGLAANDEMVGRIDVRSPLLHTAAGIGIGSTLAELQAAHPEAVEMTEAADWSRAWVIQDDAGTLVFETSPLDYLEPGSPETVISIRITAPSEDFPRHTLGTGDVVGNCGLT